MWYESGLSWRREFQARKQLGQKPEAGACPGCFRTISATELSVAGEEEEGQVRAERWDQQGEGVRPGRQQKGEMEVCGRF